jgi:thioredoxin
MFLACGDEADSEETGLEPKDKVDIIPASPLNPNNFWMAPKDNFKVNTPRATDKTVSPSALRPLVMYIGPEDFTEEVLKSNYPVVVDFYADWCGPCKYMAPYFEKLAEMHPEAKFVKYDVDQDDSKDPASVCSTYKITALPTFDFFYLGEEYPQFKVIGAKIENLRDNIIYFIDEVQKKK